ncbi:MAG: DinB family protein [Candidatus Promineifilaceae bacterium]|jgi:hypothetical protein
MLDFTAVRSGLVSMPEFAGEFAKEELWTLTNEMIDTMLALIAGCTDEDVVFVPKDPDAYDEFAETTDELAMPWTLGHVIVHATASAEEAAFLAAELARGVSMRVHRSRYEVPWESITTIDQVRRRLEESRRMRLASLEMWPDEPNLENHYIYRKTNVKINAQTRFLFGLKHDDDHLGQIAEIVRQAKESV